MNRVDPRRRRRRAAGALLALGLLLHAGVAAAAPVTLVYSGNLDGELEPCGCTAETDYGGILRRATWLDRVRAAGEDPIVVTTGGLLTADIGADRIKARFLLDGLAALDYDAVGVQWRDLVYGTDFLRRAPLPYVASNWHGDAFAVSRPIERRGVRLRYFQWLDPAASPFRAMEGEHKRVTADPAPLAAALAAARNRGEVTVLATTLDLATARATLPLEQVSVLLVAATPEIPAEPRRIGDLLVLSPGTRGMRLGRIELEVDAGGTVRAWRQEIVELTDAVPDAARLADWYEAYNDALREDYSRQVAARRARETGESPYVGAAACGACHTDAAAAWRASPHSGALGKLEAVGKAFDPNCVTCHVVGFGKPGGYLSLDATPELANVQCESCHGPGRAHVAAAGQAGLDPVREPREACAGCHHPEHSPRFRFEDYWPRIEHGLDAAAAAQTHP